MKKLLTTLFNAPEPKLKSWAAWNIKSEADINALPETDEALYGLAGNLCIDADEDTDMTEEYYKQYVAPIQNWLDEYYKPKF